MSDEGEGRKAQRALVESLRAVGDDSEGETYDDWGMALPPTYQGNCYCGAPYWRDEKLCRKHARDRLAKLGL